MDGIEEIWAAQRPYLVDLAFRMLGRIHDAEDVVQDAFSRLLRADVEAIEDVRGWLVVVVSRRCLDQLKSAKHRRETVLGGIPDVDPPAAAPVVDPADRVTLDDTLRLALLVVLEELSPAERTVFVLHDVFRFSFAAIAPIVGRSEAACRQIASRARRRISTETGPARFLADVDQQHEVAAEFIAACAGGDIERLLHLLDPNVVGDVDLGPLLAERRPLSGHQVVSRSLLGFFGPTSGTTLVSQPINGHPGLLGFRSGELVAVMTLKTNDGRIIDIHAIADPAKLAFVARQLGAGAAGRPG
jgi:RNA polymerase sigma-70 factor (ECF subfamily)